MILEDSVGLYTSIILYDMHNNSINYITSKHVLFVESELIEDTLKWGMKISLFILFLKDLDYVTDSG